MKLPGPHGLSPHGAMKICFLEYGDHASCGHWHQKLIGLGRDLILFWFEFQCSSEDTTANKLFDLIDAILEQQYQDPDNICPFAPDAGVEVKVQQLYSTTY